MTAATSPKPDLGRYGVWTGGPVTPELAVEIEKLGYGSLWLGWLGGSPGAQLKFVEPILQKTTNLIVATCVTIWSAPAKTVAESFHRIDTAYSGRLLLGVGAGHRESYHALVDYLDELDGAEVPSSRRVIAALGPKVLNLAAQRSAGAHPFLTTPEHTRRARELVGDTVYLAPEHAVVLSTDPDKARAIGRKTVAEALDITNYVNKCQRLGFAEGDLAKPGSDRLIDAVVAHGSADDIANRLNEHIEAGADHVAINVVVGPDALLPTLTALSDRLDPATDIPRSSVAATWARWGVIAATARMDQILAGAGILHGVDRSAASALTKELQPVDFPPGHVVFAEGEPGDRLYIIISGKVKIGRRSPDGRENLLTIMGPSDMFGELSIFDPGPRTSSATTITEVRAVSMDRDALRAWIADRPEIAEQLLRVLARRLRRTNNNLADLIFTDVPGRVAKQLLHLAQRFGTQEGGALRVTHDLTQDEIAQLVGASRETVNKALADFAHRGWIRLEGKSVLISDCERLTRRSHRKKCA